MTKPNRPRPFADIGAIVKAHRIRLGLTQKELAARVGPRFRNELVSRLEKGENVQLAQLHRLAVALGFTSVVEMVRAEGPAPAPDDPILERLRAAWALLDVEARRDLLKRAGEMIGAMRE